MHTQPHENRRAAIWAQAKLDGVDFRATGNEPGWTLEITEGRQIRFIHDYGQKETLAPCPGPANDLEAHRTTYSTTSGDQSLIVTLTAGPCADTMDDQIYPKYVRIDWDGRTFAGCGRPLH